MGQIHNELRKGFLSRALKNFLGSTDAEAGIERFGETLTPVVDLWRIPELGLQRGDRAYGRLVSAAAVAARFNGFQLFNPPNSGILIVGYAYGSTQNMDAGVSIGDSSAAFANLQTTNGSPMDTRSTPAGPSSIGVIHAGDAATAVIADPMLRFSGNPVMTVPWFVLAPNTEFFALCQIVNVAFEGTIFWRERRFNPEELDP